MKDKEDVISLQDSWLVKQDKKLCQKDTMLKKYSRERKRKQEDLINVTPALDAWRKVVDQLVAKKTEMEEKIKKLKLQGGFSSSSDGTP